MRDVTVIGCERCRVREALYEVIVERDVTRGYRELLCAVCYGVAAFDLEERRAAYRVGVVRVSMDADHPSRRSQ